MNAFSLFSCSSRDVMLFHSIVVLFLKGTVCFCPIGSAANLVGSGLVSLGGKGAHRCFPHHNVYCLAEAFENVFLNVGNPVLFANGLELGRPFLVLEHGQIGPHVVFDLVVEPSVGKVDGICSRGVIGAADDLAYVKASRIGFYRVVEGVQILSRVVRDNCHKSVNIREKLRQEQILKGVGCHHGGNGSRHQCPKKSRNSNVPSNQHGAQNLQKDLAPWNNLS
mmetsp:Transcript_4750/g.9861  ORF Transcript_4750/g.9861 Transcript_4750/m.9861 type:complete len:223 (+) Transcript_4750:88-756(+)